MDLPGFLDPRGAQQCGTCSRRRCHRALSTVTSEATMTSMTVVVPTFNRGARLCETVERLLACDRSFSSDVEILVVDDGSTQPAAHSLTGISLPSGAMLRVLRQPNGGPAKARNTGFHAGNGEIVLFMDDDILPPADLLRRHVAAHRERPGSVIAGPVTGLLPNPRERSSDCCASSAASISGSRPPSTALCRSSRADSSRWSVDSSPVRKASIATTSSRPPRKSTSCRCGCAAAESPSF